MRRAHRSGSQPQSARGSFVSGVRGLLRIFLGFALLWVWAPLASRASLDPDKPLTQYIHRSWQAAQGLPQNSVLAIAQTADGYLWLGTEEGLARFDGVRFTVYDRSSPGINNDEITTLFVDRHRNLWIGTAGGGLSRYDDGKFKAYSSRNGLSNNSIRALYEDRSGTLWIGTDGGGLLSLAHGKFHTFTQADGLADNAVFGIAGDRAGNLWIGTHGGLSRFSQGKFTNLHAADGLGSNFVRSVLVDSHDVLWIGTSDGLCRRSPDGETRRYTTRDEMFGRSSKTGKEAFGLEPPAAV